MAAGPFSSIQYCIMMKQLIKIFLSAALKNRQQKQPWKSYIQMRKKKVTVVIWQREKVLKCVCCYISFLNACCFGLLPAYFLKCLFASFNFSGSEVCCNDASVWSVLVMFYSAVISFWWYPKLCFFSVCCLCWVLWLLLSLLDNYSETTQGLCKDNTCHINTSKG